MKSARKYFIGLLVLGVLTLLLTAFVVVQGVRGKEDVRTHKTAQETADKINDFINKNNKIPQSLAEAGVKDAPATIKYTKKSSSEFEFCTTYKQASSLNVGSFDQILTGALAGGAITQNDHDYTDPSYLYITTSYKKGDNCQVIKPYIYSESPNLEEELDYCSPAHPDYDLYAEYCQELETSPANIN